MNRSTTVWLALFVLGGLGLILGGMLRPHGFGAAYVRDLPRIIGG